MTRIISCLIVWRPVLYCWINKLLLRYSNRFCVKKNATESPKRITKAENLSGYTELFPLTTYSRVLVYKLIFIYVVKKRYVVYVTPRLNSTITWSPSGPYIYSAHSLSFYFLDLIPPHPHASLNSLSDICFSSRLIIDKIFVWGSLFYLTTTFCQFLALLRCVGSRPCGLRKFDNLADKEWQLSIVR